MTPPTLQPISRSNEGILSWIVYGPKRLFRLPRNRKSPLHFQFRVKNNATETQRVKVQLESPSPILVLRKSQSKHMSKSRLYAKITSLGHAIEQDIPPQKEVTYAFDVDYAPHLTTKLPSTLHLYFGIFLYSEKNKIQQRFGPRKIALSITKQDAPGTPVDEYIV